jgi:hypothetical protein
MRVMSSRDLSDTLIEGRLSIALHISVRLWEKSDTGGDPDRELLDFVTVSFPSWQPDETFVSFVN